MQGEDSVTGSEPQPLVDAAGSSPGTRSPSVADQLAESRKELLDVTLRNPLLAFRPLKAKGLRIVDEIPREIFRRLVEQERSMDFLAAREDTEATSRRGSSAAGPEGAGSVEAESAAFGPAGAKIAGAAPLQEAVDEGDALGPAARGEDVPAELRALIAADARREEPAARHVDNKLQTAHDVVRMDVRLRNTLRHARSSIEEQGVNILYLALGALVWYESESSETPRTAPLVLVPVELSRGNVQVRFKVRWTGEEIDANLSLETKLRGDFGIRLPELGQDEDLDVDAYFSQVEAAVGRRERWRVERNAVHLSFFSFSKLLIYKDLDPAVHPEDENPADHPIVQSLYGGGFRGEPSSVEEAGSCDDGGPWMDEVLEQEAVHQVVDSDSSQTLAVMDVVAGRNLVIQGPPGTGKSQTITNLIAECVARGKTVLFVAEKMAALEVVKRRLDAVHLGDACLELHSRTANKSATLAELKRTVELGKPQFEDPEGDRMLLDRARDRLNEYSIAVNSPVGRSGLAPQQLVGELTRVGGPERPPGDPALELPEPESWSRDDFRQRREDVREMQELVERIGVPRDHPYWGSAHLQYMPGEGAGVAQALNDVAGALREHWADARRLASALGLGEEDAASSSAARVGVLLETAGRAAEAPELSGVRRRAPEWTTRSDEIRSVARNALEFARICAEHDAVLIPEAWRTNVLPFRQVLAQGGDKWWRFLSGDHRRAVKGLRGLCRSAPPRRREDQMALLDAILAARRLHDAIGRARKLTERVLGRSDLDWDWQAHRRIGEVAQWLVRLHRDVADGSVDACVHDVLDAAADTTEIETAASACRRSRDGLAETLATAAEVLKLDECRFAPDAPPGERSFQDVRRWLDRARGDVDAIQDVVLFNKATERLASRGLESVAQAASSWSDAGRELVRLFEHRCYSAWIGAAWRERPLLGEFHGSAHDSVAERFRRLDKSLLVHNRALVAQRHWAGVPRGPGGGQMGVLAREFAKKRRHLPLRKLMTEAGAAVLAIKPVFMMSPLSIAKFVPPGSVRFDLVIFDEASQVRPVEAMGAIMRAGQAVVVGDSKQLPPTTFFDRLAEDDDQERFRTADLESVLGMFCAQQAPERMLRWHYRSRHESLIAVSNSEFYDGRLVVFPSPDKDRQNTGLRLRHEPESFYERGGVNPGEARAVARAVVEHAVESPELTLGVAAFSLSQARRIEDELEILRRRDASGEPFFARRPEEPFFVKNLENVQGDERDVIFVSVGYGRTKDGRLPMNFGPLNQDGGERRLNVLVTRARRRCVVYANFQADDLDLRRSGARGIAALKTFLHYAATGRLGVPQATGRGADSPFEEAVASELRARGHEVAHQVGSAGFFVDLAVVDPSRPGRYLLGIECDGATYHSARSARDRDRLRQEVLEGLGWTIHRIWSTDWFRNHEREMERVAEAIRQATQASAGLENGRPDSRSGLDGAVRAKAGAGADADAEQRPPSPGLRRKPSLAPSGPPDPSMPYRMADVEVDLAGRHLHEIGLNELLGWLDEVVAVESPVHVAEASVRLARAAGVARAGSRIRDQVRGAARLGADFGKLVSKGEFLWRPDHRQVLVRRRDEVAGDLRQVDKIAPEEIAEAFFHVIRASHGIKDDEAVRAAARLFRFKRVGSKLEAGLREVLDELKADRRISVRNGFCCVNDEGVRELPRD